MKLLYFKREGKNWLRPGDVVGVEIGGLGKSCNKMVG